MNQREKRRERKKRREEENLTGSNMQDGRGSKSEVSEAA